MWSQVDEHCDWKLVQILANNWTDDFLTHGEIFIYFCTLQFPFLSNKQSHIRHSALTRILLSSLHTSRYMFAWVHVSKFCNLFKIFTDFGPTNHRKLRQLFPQLLQATFLAHGVRSQLFPRLLQARFPRLPSVTTFPALGAPAGHKFSRAYC